MAQQNINLLSLLSVSNDASHPLAQSCPGTRVLFLYIAISIDYKVIINQSNSFCFDILEAASQKWSLWSNLRILCESAWTDSLWRAILILKTTERYEGDYTNVLKLRAMCRFSQCMVERGGEEARLGLFKREMDSSGEQGANIPLQWAHNLASICTAFSLPSIHHSFIAPFSCFLSLLLLPPSLFSFSPPLQLVSGVSVDGTQSFS